MILEVEYIMPDSKPNSLLNKKKFIQDQYNNESYVEIYDTRYENGQADKFEALWKQMKKVWDETPKSIVQRIMTLLDIGCGTGLFFDFLNRRTTQKLVYHFIGLDLSRGMLKAFRNKIKFFDAQAILIEADAENLPLRDGTIPIVTGFTSLQNLPNLEQGLSEIRRILHIPKIIAISILKKHKDFQNLTIQLNKVFESTYFRSSHIFQEEKWEDWLFFYQAN